MKNTSTVAEIMTPEVITVQEEASLFDVMALIRKHHVRHLHVLRGKELIGIISSNDINRLTFGGLFDQADGIDDSIASMMTVPQVMTADPIAVRPDDLVLDAARIFAQGKYHSLPVVDQGEIAGIVTTTDLIRLMVQEFEAVPLT